MIRLADGPAFHRRDQVRDGEKPDIGDGFSADAELKGVLLEATAAAIATGGVSAEAAEEDADVHLVGAGFQPVEEPAHTIPLLVRPGFLGVVGLALNDPLLILLREIGEGSGDGDAFSFGRAFEVVLALAVSLACEGFDEAIADAEVLVGHRLADVEAERASKATAGGAGPDGVVEAEEAGRGGGETDVAVGATPVGAVGEGRWCCVLGAGFRGNDDAHLAFSETEGGFDGLAETGALGGVELDPVLDDEDPGGESLLAESVGLVGAVGLAEDVNAEVALTAEEGEEIGGGCLGGNLDLEADESGLPSVMMEEVAKDAGGRFGTHWTGTLRAGGLRETREDHLQVVIDLGDRADGGAGGANVVDLLDGDGGRDAVDGIDLGLVHALEKLARVGRERLDVSALALGVDRVEGEGRLAAPAGAGDDAEFADGEIDIDALEVVLVGSTDLNHVMVGSVGLLGLRGGTLGLFFREG